MTDVVAFDLRAAGGSRTGVGRHILSIVHALAENNPDMRLRAYVREPVADLPAGVEIVHIASRGFMWHLRTWRHLRRHRVRAYCSTSLIIPALTSVPCLPIVLDVISFLYPGHQTLRTRLFERLLMKGVVRRHPLIAGSATTRRDLETLFGSCRAVVVPPWVPPPMTTTADPELLERLGIKTPFVLYVGTVEPRKNVLTAAHAVATLRAKGLDVRLILVGGRGWVDSRTLAELAEAESAGTVGALGYRPDRERDAVFAAASCLVLPSVYEGFGLPLLEAMERGLPCISSTAPAFREVAGDASLHVEPDDEAGWATAIERVLTDTSLAAGLASAGLRRALEYSPAATARAFVSALEQLP